MTKTFEELEEKVQRLDERIATHHAQHVALNKVVDDLIATHQREQGGAHVSALAERVKALETLLLGDQEERTRYEDGIARNTIPRPKEPPMGMIDSMQNGIESLNARMGQLLGEIEKRFTFVTKLQAFFGPLLENKNPPLDGEEMPTKRWVDASIERIAGAIRRELSIGLAGQTTRTERAVAMADAFFHALPRISQLNTHDILPAQVFMAWVDRIATIAVREQRRADAEEAAANRPSRLELIRSALTGQPPRSNHHGGFR